MATIKDIAERVGLSKGVVSSYLNDPATTRVSAARKVLIDEAVRDLKYVPNSHARSLSIGRSNLINILILFREPLFRNSVVNEILSGIGTGLERHGFGMVFPSQRYGMLQEMAREQIRSGHGNAGYIVIGTRYSTSDDMHQTADELEKRDVPFVMTNAPDLHRPVSQVLVHGNRSSSAIQHLLGAGHRRILVLAGTEYDPECDYEIQEVLSAFRQLGTELDPELLVYAGYDFRKAKIETIDAVDRGVEFTAVYSLSREMAMGASQGLLERGLSVPGDITIATIAESRFLEYYHFPFIVVETDYFRMGEEAAKLLMTHIDRLASNAKFSPRTVRLESRMVVPHTRASIATKTETEHAY
jgi:LacI family transcriptional regulator